MFCCLHIFVNIILVFVEVKKIDFCVVVNSFLSTGTLVGLTFFCGLFIEEVLATYPNG